MTLSETGFGVQQESNEKMYITWKAFNDYIKLIQKYVLEENFLADAIVTLHKGGIIPSTILSYSLKVNDIYDIKIKEGEMYYMKDIVTLNRKNILLVDNIIEKGENIAHIINLLQKVTVGQIMVVTVISKEAELPLVVPHFAAKTIPKDYWVIFPWEELNY